ncbi:MAG TPA: hypothetical protein VF457_11660, partial [Burkholderiaceae bacterium]
MNTARPPEGARTAARQGEPCPVRQPASTSPCNEPGRGDIGNRFMVRLGSVVRRTLRRLSLAA